MATWYLAISNAANALQDVKQIKDNLEKCHFTDLHTRFIVFELVTINPSQGDTVLLVEFMLNSIRMGSRLPGIYDQTSVTFQ